MNQNSMAIIILCSHLCTNAEVKPLEPMEWTKFAILLRNNDLQPEDILQMNISDLQKKLHLGKDEAWRVAKLVDRSVSIVFEIERILSKGIGIMTRADNHYPKALKKKLGNMCPPLFYYVGNPSILENKFIGLVGSRSVSDVDMAFTEKIVESSCSKGFSIVSGGAKGVDATATASALKNDAMCLEYISDSLLKKIRNKQVIDAVRNDRLLLMSASKPDAGFSIGMAMARNKYIYSQSEGTVVVKSDYNKGGTWSGAYENIKHNRSRTLVWNNLEYKGNIELINKGATPVDESWGADFPAIFSINETQNEMLTLENCQ